MILGLVGSRRDQGKHRKEKVQSENFHDGKNRPKVSQNGVEMQDTVIKRFMKTQGSKEEKQK